MASIATKGDKSKFMFVTPTPNLNKLKSILLYE